MTGDDGGGGNGPSITLGASATNVGVGTSVTLSALASIDVGPTPYFIVILDGSNTAVHVCASGTTCGASVTRTAAGSMTYTAVIGNSSGGSPQALSTSVTVTWGSSASMSLVVTVPTPYVAGVPHSVTVQAKDGTGARATGYRGVVHFTSSDTSAVLPANYQFTAADKGIHTFSVGLTLKMAGSQWVRASDTVATSVTGVQNGIAVTAGATRGLVVLTAVSAVAGASRNLIVRAVDGFGNTTAGYRGTVHLTSSDTRAVLPADYTFTAADAGIHTYSVAPAVVLKTAGSKWLRATDMVKPAITGVQTGVVVTPASAVGLVISVPGTYVAGCFHTATLQAVDAYGNIATGYRGTVRFSSSDARAVLPASYQFTAGDGGIHRFSVAITFKTAGSHWVRATDIVATSVTAVQTGIVVVAGAA